MDQIVDWYQQANGASDWMIKVFVVIFFTLLAHYLARRFYNRLEKQFEKTKNLWDDALLWAIRKPSRSFILILGVRTVAEIMQPLMDESVNALVDPAFLVMIISVIIWFLIRMISKAE